MDTSVMKEIGETTDATEKGEIEGINHRIVMHKK
jgi:hypothetical protein